MALLDSLSTVGMELTGKHLDLVTGGAGYVIIGGGGSGPGPGI